MLCSICVCITERSHSLFYETYKEGGMDVIIYSLTVEPLSEFNLAIILDARSAEPMM